jgi:hypothetical protein
LQTFATGDRPAAMWRALRQSAHRPSATGLSGHLPHTAIEMAEILRSVSKSAKAKFGV